jgi:glutathione synthase/RimK-type ligase-like ATP-grasp enzyme
LQYIPKENEIIEYGWQFNLSKGSRIVEVGDKLKEFLSEFAISVSKAVNLNFGSVDIIEIEDNKFMVLEANSGVMMDNLMHLLDNGHEIAKEIYSEAIDLMFSNF